MSNWNSYYKPSGARRDRIDEELKNLNQSHIESEEMRQVQIIRQQDVQLDVLHEATGQLKQMSVVMGDEIDKQDKAIDGLGEDIDRNKNKIGILNKTIDKVRNTKHKGLWCTIFILAMILVALIIILFKTIF